MTTLFDPDQPFWRGAYVWKLCFQSICKKLWWKVDFQIETLWHSKIIRFAEQSTRIYLRYLSYLYIRAVVCSTRPKTAWTLNFEFWFASKIVQSILYDFLKVFLVSVNSPKKQTNKFVFTTEMNLFDRFWENSRIPKSPFEIIWTSGSRIISGNSSVKNIGQDIYIRKVHMAMGQRIVMSDRTRFSWKLRFAWYSSDKIRKTQNDHLNIICQNLNNL